MRSVTTTTTGNLHLWAHLSFPQPLPLIPIGCNLNRLAIVLIVALQRSEDAIRPGGQAGENPTSPTTYSLPSTSRFMPSDTSRTLIGTKFGLHAIIVLLKCCHLWRFTMESYQPCSILVFSYGVSDEFRFDFVDVLLQVLMDGGCMLSMDGDSLRLAWRQVDCEYLFPELALILDACRGKMFVVTIISLIPLLLDELETISTLLETLRFTYSETLGKWPIGDLAFGINFLLKRQVSMSFCCYP
ncbi:hypothetical protein C3L33_08841, partial [Rhododendron williamsianum]